MKPSTADRFRGMRWLFLRNNQDTYASRRGTSEVKTRPIFDTMLELGEETPEGLLEETYRRVAANLPASKAAEGQESAAQFLAEVKERKKLRKWKEGRSYREPLVSSLDSEDRQVLSSHLADPQSYRQSVRQSAEKRLESIFEPGLWSQLQELKRANREENSETRGLLPQLGRKLSTHREEKREVEVQRKGAVRRKHYGKWYLRPKDWNTRFQKEMERTSGNAK